MDGKPLPVYGDGSNVRDWLYVEDHADGPVGIAARGARPASTYCSAAAPSAPTSRSSARSAPIMDRAASGRRAAQRLITFVADRPGHDQRYAIDATKAERELGWKPQKNFEVRLFEETIDWYLTNEDWWEPLRAPATRVSVSASPARARPSAMDILVVGEAGRSARSLPHHPHRA